MEKYYEIHAGKNNIRCKVYSEGKGPAERAVIYCTGFAGHKDNNAANRFAGKVLSKYKNVSVLVFNWPAHGDDVKKKLALEDCNTYLEEVIRDAKSRFGVQSLYAYATSFGGYLTLKYIRDRGNPFEKISLRCPAIDMYDVLTRAIMKNDEYARIMKGKDAQVGFDRKVTVTAALLEELQANDIRTGDYRECADRILILHGTKDEVVPIGDSWDFAEKNGIQFIPVEGADHRFQNPDHMSLANKLTLEFFGF